MARTNVRNVTKLFVKGIRFWIFSVKNANKIYFNEQKSLNISKEIVLHLSVRLFPLAAVLIDCSSLNSSCNWTAIVGQEKSEWQGGGINNFCLICWAKNEKKKK